MSGRQGRLGTWDRPVQPWPADRERWQRFCAEIADRIEAARVWSAEHLYWRTFNPPIPSSVDGHPMLPTGRVRPGPTNGDRRDTHGRFRKQEDG